MNRISFFLHKRMNPILWTKTSEAFYSVLTRYIRKQDTVIEIGSGTGHVSYLLAKAGYTVTLNELREECLIESQHRFEQHGVHARYLHKNLFSISKRYDFLWNSGLIQCFSDKDKHKLAKKLAAIAPKVLLFYPDTEDAKKDRGNNTKKLPGVDDAKEYPIHEIPTIMNHYFKKLSMGTLEAEEIGLPYPMYWVLGDNT